MSVIETRGVAGSAPARSWRAPGCGLLSLCGAAGFAQSALFERSEFAPSIVSHVAQCERATKLMASCLSTGADPATPRCPDVARSSWLCEHGSRPHHPALPRRRTRLMAGVRAPAKRVCALRPAPRAGTP
jgi:hypothetical protein